MKAEELRIGNLFIEKYTQQLINVEELKKDKIVFSGKFLNEWQAEPIPLTSEWLLKFGFRQAGNTTIFKEIGSIEIGKIGKRFYLQIRCENITLNIKYVHQLQNLYFALTGRQLLTIK